MHGAEHRGIVGRELTHQSDGDAEIHELDNTGMRDHDVAGFSGRGE